MTINEHVEKQILRIIIRIRDKGMNHGGARCGNRIVFETKKACLIEVRNAQKQIHVKQRILIVVARHNLPETNQLHHGKSLSTNSKDVIFNLTVSEQN